MKITLMVVGKTTDTRLQTLIEDYQQRLKHYVPFVRDFKVNTFENFFAVDTSM